MPVELMLECLGADRAVALRAVGGCSALGNWDPARGAALRRCASGASARWELVDGPLLLSDNPDGLPSKLEYCYVMLCRDAGGDYHWEDLGSLKVPMLRCRGSAGRHFCQRRVNRCLMMPGHGHALLARSDRWEVVEGCGEESAWCGQNAWSVPEDFAPGIAGASWTIGPCSCRAACKDMQVKECSGGGAEQAHALFVGVRRARLLRGMGQLTQQMEERGIVPCHVWMHVGEFLGDTAALSGL